MGPPRGLYYERRVSAAGPLPHATVRHATVEPVREGDWELPDGYSPVLRRWDLVATVAGREARIATAEGEPLVIIEGVDALAFESARDYFVVLHRGEGSRLVLFAEGCLPVRVLVAGCALHGPLIPLTQRGAYIARSERGEPLLVRPRRGE